VSASQVDLTPFANFLSVTILRQPYFGAHADCDRSALGTRPGVPGGQSWRSNRWLRGQRKRYDAVVAYNRSTGEHAVLWAKSKVIVPVVLVCLAAASCQKGTTQRATTGAQSSPGTRACVACSVAGNACSDGNTCQCRPGLIPGTQICTCGTACRLDGEQP